MLFRIVSRRRLEVAPAIVRERPGKIARKIA
jgi:hypothetical protein